MACVRRPRCCHTTGRNTVAGRASHCHSRDREHREPPPSRPATSTGPVRRSHPRGLPTMRWSGTRRTATGPTAVEVLHRTALPAASVDVCRMRCCCRVGGGTLRRRSGRCRAGRDAGTVLRTAVVAANSLCRQDSVGLQRGPRGHAGRLCRCAIARARHGVADAGDVPAPAALDQVVRPSGRGAGRPGKTAATGGSVRAR